MAPYSAPTGRSPPSIPDLLSDVRSAHPNPRLVLDPRRLASPSGGSQHLTGSEASERDRRAEPICGPRSRTWRNARHATGRNGRGLAAVERGAQSPAGRRGSRVDGGRAARLETARRVRPLDRARRPVRADRVLRPARPTVKGHRSSAHRAVISAGRGEVRSIIATSDVRAQARYYAAGTVARFPLFTMGGAPAEASPRSDGRPDRRTSGDSSP